MSTSPEGVVQADRLARGKFKMNYRTGDIRVTGLVSEAGTSKVLGYLEAADIDQRASSSRQQTGASASSSRATPSGPTS